MSCRAPVLLLIASFAGCASPVESRHGEVTARLGETVWLGGAKLTPLAVLEDSRCPAAVQCIQAGRIRVNTRIEGRGSIEQVFELESSADSDCVRMVDASPAPVANAPTVLSAYRFTFAATSCEIPF